MVTIGFISGDLSLSHGAAHYSLQLIRAIQRAGYDVQVVASRNTPADHGLPVASILPALVPADRWVLPRSLLQMWQARDILRDCDLIHSANELFAPLAALVAGERPMIQTLHGTYANLPRMRRYPVGALYRAAYRRAELVCVSRYTARVAGENAPGARIHVIPNGVDAPTVTPAADSQTPSARPVILATGGVKARKGTLHIVRALAVVRERYPSAQVVIVGNPRDGSEYTRAVRAEVERLNLRDAVIFTGFVPDETLWAWYNAADVFVMPSMNHGYSFEGFGLVHLEAGHAGLPVIGTRDCGIEDAIRDGVTGLLVSQAGIDAELPRAILRLLADDDLRRSMGENGRQWARQHTWDSAAQHYIALYQVALERQTLT